MIRKKIELIGLSLFIIAVVAISARRKNRIYIVTPAIAKWPVFKAPNGNLGVGTVSYLNE